MSSDSPSRREQVGAFCLKFGISDMPEASLDLAFTHRSYAFEQGIETNNERLEFLGDAVLAALSSELLYSRFPEMDEGALSKKRAQLVSRVMLGLRAAEMGIGALLLLGVGEKRSGGEGRDSVVGDALEALIGAVYLHGGYDRARRFTLDHVIEPLMPRLGEESAQGDYKSALQEWSQRVHGCLPVYRLLGQAGPDHAKTFQVEASIRDDVLAVGEGPRIKIAENEAARLALEKMRES